MIFRLFNSLVPVPLVYVAFNEKRLHARRIKDGRAVKQIEMAPLIAVRKRDKKKEWETVAVGEDALNYSGQEENHIWVCNPFSHPRLVFHNYVVAELLIACLIKNVTSPFILRRPAVVIHSLRTQLNPITDVEHRALADSTLHSGAQIAWIITAATELTDSEIIEVGRKTYEPFMSSEVPTSHVQC